jgi:tyrosine-specific transport protein
MRTTPNNPKIRCVRAQPATQRRRTRRNTPRLGDLDVLRQALTRARAGRGAGSSEGDDPRLFSNLSGDLRHEPGSVWGAAALVSGTAVGAGILAIPAVTAPAGFVAGSAAMTAAAAWSVLSGLLVAEVSVNTMCELGTGRGVSLGSMARRTLGPAGAVAVSVVYAVLHYSLLVACECLARARAWCTNCTPARRAP